MFHSPPIVGWDVPKYYAHKAMFDKDNSSIHTHSFTNYKSYISNFNNIIDSIENENLYYFNLASLFCSEVTNRCIMNKGKKLLYRDEYHLSMYGSKIAVKNLLKSLN